MPEETTYVIERLELVTLRNYQPTVLKEITAEAWVHVGEVTTDRASWLVVEDWFNAQPDSEKKGGRYRMVREYSHAGGTYEEYVISPTWKVETPEKHKAEEVVA